MSFPSTILHIDIVIVFNDVDVVSLSSHLIHGKKEVNFFFIIVFVNEMHTNAELNFARETSLKKKKDNRHSSGTQNKNIVFSKNLICKNLSLLHVSTCPIHLDERH